MKVADTSYIVEGLLRKKELIEEQDQILTSYLAIFEVTNALWKHEHLLKDIDDGLDYLTIFYGLVDSRKILPLDASEELLRSSSLLARRNEISTYDAIFVALAVSTGLELLTFDQRQSEVMRRETRRS